MALLRQVGPVCAIAVQLARSDCAYVAVPDAVGAFAQYQPPQLLAPAGVEQAQFDPLGITGKDGKVAAFGSAGRTQRIGGTS